MLLIRFVFILMLASSVQAGDDQNTNCLSNLGGAFVGVECYISLAAEIDSKNRHLESDIVKKMHAQPHEIVLLKKYILSANKSESFCKLQRDAYANWNIESTNKGSRYYDYDVVYFECVYNKKIETNKFLTQLLEYLNQ